MAATWPQQLEDAVGPFSAERIDGAAKGMGDHGRVTRSLVENGSVQPDLLTGMTLYLLARQPRPAPDPSAASRPKASPIDGGVWVREQFTIHRPLAREDRFVVSGASTGRYIRKGRRYGTTTAQARNQAGALVTTNLTTGLLAYKVHDDLADSVEGLPLADTPTPDADHSVAHANPHLDQLRSAKSGQRLGGEPVVVSLAMMAARDGASPDNPIHSDPAAAKAAGLDRPIAGGSHVLAFALEPILATFGAESLFHGALIDARWKAPTHAEATIVPNVVVTDVAADHIQLTLDVLLEDSSTAMTGSITIPLPS